MIKQQTHSARRRFPRLVLVCSLIFLCASQHGNAQQQTIVAPSRSVDWSTAGVAGGIPPRPTICSTLNPGASSSQITSALASCPSGQTVKLNPGTYTIAGIDFGGGKSNVTLRGSGADQTFLVFTSDVGCHGFRGDICMQSSDLNWKGQPSNLVNWTGGYSKGATAVTLASVANLKVGFPLILDQLDDGSDNGSVFVSDSQGTATPTGTGISGPFSLEGNGGGAQRPTRNQVQIVTVTACGGVTTPGASCSGTNVNVSISPGLAMPNWRASQSPQAWWPTSPSMGLGIEDVSMDHTSTGNAGVEVFNCLNCWVKGVRDINTGRAHVQVQMSARVTIRDSYFFLTQNSVSQSYGFECYTGSDILVENNIYQAIASPEMINGACSGLVVGYNFNINNYYVGSSRYSLAGTNSHTGGIDNGLYEGNVGNQLYADVFHGTHNFITAFRNRWSGSQPACWVSGSPYASATFGACNNNMTAIVLLSFSRFYNLIGNVLGTAGVDTSYESYPGGPNSGTAVIEMGTGNGTVPADPNVRPTTMRWGNWDVVTAGARFQASEVPSSLSGAQAPYSNPVPSSQVLPASFYLPARPAWWPVSKAWPPIGPDVTGGNIPNVGGHAYTIPAQDCFTGMMGGPADGTGPARSFNAANCYPTATGSAPSAPVNLRIVSN